MKELRLALVALRARKEGVLPGPAPKHRTKRKANISEVIRKCNSERTTKSIQSITKLPNPASVWQWKSYEEVKIFQR